MITILKQIKQYVLLVELPVEFFIIFFKYLLPLKKSIVFKKNINKQQYTHSDIIKIQYIKNKNNILIFSNLFFRDPHQTVKLFSPQKYFIFTDKKIYISWTKIYICLKDSTKLSITIDSTTFISILTSFYNNNQFVSKLSTSHITDEILYKLYYKLDYLNFHYIFWIYKKSTIFNKQIILFVEILIYNNYFKTIFYNSLI